jgi:hypothetical protein
VGAVFVAIASSLPLGAALGVVAAALSHGNVRPRRALREHRRLAASTGVSVAVATSAVVAVAATQVGYQRIWLALTCATVALLTAFVAWLLLVESDDDDRTDVPFEPEWWPAFERELEEWMRGSRLPSGSAH